MMLRMDRCHLWLSLLHGSVPQQKHLGPLHWKWPTATRKSGQRYASLPTYVPLRYSTASITIGVRPSMGNRKQQVLPSSAHMSLKLTTKVDIPLSDLAKYVDKTLR